MWQRTTGCCASRQTRARSCSLVDCVMIAFPSVYSTQVSLPEHDHAHVDRNFNAVAKCTKLRGGSAITSHA